MFKTEDVERYCAGLDLTAAQSAEWLKIANQALEAAEAVGADTLEAELNAVKTANSVFRSASQKHSDAPVRPAVGASLAVVLAEVGEASDGFQMVLPVGYWFNRWYGDLIFTQTYCQRVVDNWKAKVLGKREPFLDTEHDRGAANAWVVDMEARADGLYVKWDWTDRGRELVAKRIYRFYSADLETALDIKTGKEVYPVLAAVALTNCPAMNTLPDAHLSDQPGAHGDALKPPAKPGKEEDNMELSDVITFAKAAPETDRDQILSAIAPDLKTEAEALKAANLSLTERLSAMEAEKKAARKVEVIGKALSEGKILPKDKEAWERRFDASPDVIAEILASMPAAVDLTVRGTGDAPDAVALTEDDKRVRKAFGITDEDAKKFGGE